MFIERNFGYPILVSEAISPIGVSPLEVSPREGTDVSYNVAERSVEFTVVVALAIEPR